MDNTETLIRQIIREEIKNICEDVAETSSALTNAKNDATAKREAMENAEGFDKLKLQKEFIRSKRNVLNKIENHVRSNKKKLDQEEKIINHKINQSRKEGNVGKDADAGMGF